MLLEPQGVAGAGLGLVSPQGEATCVFTHRLKFLLVQACSVPGRALHWALQCLWGPAERQGAWAGSRGISQPGLPQNHVPE